MAEYYLYVPGEERPFRRLQLSGDQDAGGFPVLIQPTEPQQVHACAECGTEDETVAGGGTALCRYCAELSALHAPAKERRYRQRVTATRLALLIAAVSIWIFVATLLLCSGQDPLRHVGNLIGGEGHRAPVRLRWEDD